MKKDYTVLLIELDGNLASDVSATDALRMHTCHFRIQRYCGYLCTVLFNTRREDISGPHTDNYNC